MGFRSSSGKVTVQVRVKFLSSGHVWLWIKFGFRSRSVSEKVTVQVRVKFGLRSFQVRVKFKFASVSGQRSGQVWISVYSPSLRFKKK